MELHGQIFRKILQVVSMEKGLERSKREEEKLGGKNHIYINLKVSVEKRIDLREIVENISNISGWVGCRFEGLVESWWITLIFLSCKRPV